MKRTAPTMLLGTLGFLTACKGNQVAQVDPSLSVELVVDGGVSLTFADLLDGGLPFGNDPVLVPVARTLVLTDLGGGGLIVSGVTIVPAASPFSVLPPLPGAVSAGAGTPLIVQFLPVAQQAYQAEIQIASDDPQRPTVTVPVTGNGSTEGQLTVSPNPLAFGSVGQGQTQVATLTLSSVGSAPLRISDLSLAPGSDPAFAFVSSTQTPFTLTNQAPANTLPLSLSFSPSAQTLAAPVGSVQIQSSDPAQQTLTVPLTGQTILAPIAAINVPTTAAVGAQVVLDGSGSSDPNVPPSLPLTYQWSLTKKPLGSAAQIFGIFTAVQPTLTIDDPGLYDVQLDVTNAFGIQDSAPAHASITARPTDDLYVEMVWDNDPIDMDLHLMAAGATLDGPGDCNAFTDDAGFGCVHGSDHLVGPGPEWASVASPSAQTYSVACVLYAAHNAASLSTQVTVRIFVYGVLTAQLTQQLDALGAVWNAATITWPSATITPIGTVTP